MSLLETLQQLQNRRRFPNWKPEPSSGTAQDTSSTKAQVILRALDFLPLELQVADWDKEASLVPELEDIESILERNAADEQKHDLALTYLSKYYGKQGVEDIRGAKLLHDWKATNAHPVAAMYALEMGVFFSILPALLTCGDVYAASVAQWISDDERIHVETNAAIMLAAGVKLTKQLVQLVHETNYYIFSSLGVDYATAQANRAVKRLVSGKDSQMLRESLPVTIAYFEQHSKQNIVY